MTAENINIGETHIRLRTDIEDHGVAGFILGERMKLIGHIQRNHEFFNIP